MRHCWTILASLTLKRSASLFISFCPRGATFSLLKNMQKPSRAVELADHTVLPLNNGGNQKKKREFNEAPPVYDITQPTSSFPSVIRRVRPSIQSFDTFAKGRWVGRELLEILSKEFGGHTPEYWLNGILQGHIRINGAKVTPNFVLRNNDRLLHRTHRLI